MLIERRCGLAREAFLDEFLGPRRPVIVTDALPGQISLDSLVARFGGRQVPLYDELFLLIGLTTLSDYVRSYGQARPAYLRWYSRQSAHPRYPWADPVFEALASEWAMPAFLPDRELLLPFCPPGERRDAVRDAFPARGLYLSPRGARTRLHCDPWYSDAALCQFEGDKRVRIVDPRDAGLVTRPGREFADLAAPDPGRFPGMERVRLLFDDVLRPGEVLYIPQGCLHDVETLTDSVSITWNFCHARREAGLRDYVANEANEAERQDVAFFGYV